MLRIAIPSNTASELNYASFERYELPQPPSGIDAEVNNDLILQFEDEDEAITYADQLETLSDNLDDETTPQYIAINDIITAIRNDEFIQDYES